MKKYFLFTIIFSILFIYGCADCQHESDYDYVGVTLDEFIAKSGIKVSEIHNSNCKNPAKNITCSINATNPNKYNQNLSFTVSCNGGYTFNLKQTINSLFPMEEYKDDKFEQCSDYYVYDFIADRHRSEQANPVTNVSINDTDNNIWYVEIGGICKEWNVKDTKFEVKK